jgi:hypothetical protein
MSPQHPLPVTTRKPNDAPELDERHDAPRSGDRRDRLPVLHEEPDSSKLGLTDRTRAVAETSGALTGVYTTKELERLGEDWPA